MTSMVLVLVSCLVVSAFDADLYENLAKNKPATQSSVASEVSYATAQKANDGNRSNVENMWENSCIHTAYSNNQQHKEAWWLVDLEFISRIHEVLITHRNWGSWPQRSSAGRFAGFSIYVSNSSDFKNGTACFQQNGSKPDVQRTSYPCSAIGRFVTVYNNRTHILYPAGYSDEAVLELCEVEIPGCQFQHFGHGCSNRCFCKELTCDFKTGQCNGECQSGYVGGTCNKTCDPGYYGKKCLSSCQHCGGNKTCNQSGLCLDGCEVGFYPDHSPGCLQQCGKCLGIRCNLDGRCPLGCSDGYYMHDCKAECQSGCYNKTCDQQSGHCTSCVDGYFGEGCNKECPQYCSQRKCEQSSGDCLACEPGHYGYNCAGECLHCGGDKTCNDSGVCLNGCEIGHVSDCSPGCLLKVDSCKQDMTAKLTMPLVVGVLSGLFLVVLGTIMNVILYRRNRADIEKTSQIYIKSVAGNPTEHVYSDIQPGIENDHMELNEELGDIQNGDSYKTTRPNTVVYGSVTEEVAGIKTDPSKDYQNCDDF